MNTNMVTEAFHNVCFQRKQNKRIDHLLCSLLKIARDKTFEGLIKVEKGKRSCKQRETDKSHKNGMEISRQGVRLIEDKRWCV